MIGFADVDNPGVPNMDDVTPGGAIEDHGLFWPDNSSTTVLSLPLNVSSLPHDKAQPGPGYEFYQVPKARVLDALSFHTTYVSPYTNCPELVHRNFDRAMAFLFLGDEFTLSAQRRTAVVLPGGRKLLQHTRSTDADFVAAARSPGVLP
jgi:hypothetical protein